MILHNPNDNNIIERLKETIHVGGNACWKFDILEQGVLIFQFPVAMQLKFSNLHTIMYYISQNL